MLDGCGDRRHPVAVGGCDGSGNSTLSATGHADMQGPAGVLPVSATVLSRNADLRDGRRGRRRAAGNADGGSDRRPEQRPAAGRCPVGYVGAAIRRQSYIDTVTPTISADTGTARRPRTGPAAGADGAGGRAGSRARCRPARCSDVADHRHARPASSPASTRWPRSPRSGPPSGRRHRSFPALLVVFALVLLAFGLPKLSAADRRHAAHPGRVPRPVSPARSAARRSRSGETTRRLSGSNFSDDPSLARAAAARARSRSCRNKRTCVRRHLEQSKKWSGPWRFDDPGTWPAVLLTTGALALAGCGSSATTASSSTSAAPSSSSASRSAVRVGVDGCGRRGHRDGDRGRRLRRHPRHGAGRAGHLRHHQRRRAGRDGGRAGLRPAHRR